MCGPTAQLLRCYGDMIFAESTEISHGYDEPSAAQAAENNRMNKPRTSVEWSFTITDQRCQTLRNKYDMKLFSGPPLGEKVVCCTLLSNFYTCLVGNQLNTYFGSTPPSLEMYLAGHVIPAE